MRFKEFLLNEQQAYLGQKVGAILTAAQELRDDAKNMGTRDLTRFSQKIVNQIRRVLHSHWPKEEKKYLKSLQKVGVAIMKSIDEHDDLPGTIAGAASALEKLVADLGVPIHKLGDTTKDSGEQDATGTAEPEKPNTQKTGIIDQAQQTAPPAPPLATPPLGGTGQQQLPAF